MCIRDRFMTKMSTMKLSLFYVILFNFAAIIPYPSAWFPLNEEIKKRTASGNKWGEVYLSLGPDGTQDRYLYILTIFMTKMSTMKLSLFYVILFNVAAIIPYPSAWFPLNEEIKKRTASGNK